MKKVYVSLGTNLGDRNRNLLKAIQYLNVGVGHIIDLSGIYETEPWGFESTEKFLNMTVELITDLTPQEVLSKCLEIEVLLGRTRIAGTGYTSRTIDVDILFYSDLVIETSSLTIPHANIQNRRFVLEPLCEIAPELIHPVFQISISEMLKNCTDSNLVKQLGSLQGNI